MISFARESPRSSIKYLQAKTNFFDRSKIKSSPQARGRIFQYRHHTKDICPACTSPKDQEKISSANSSMNFDDIN